jgi:hypothetical protein
MTGRKPKQLPLRNRTSSTYPSNFHPAATNVANAAGNCIAVDQSGYHNAHDASFGANFGNDAGFVSYASAAPAGQQAYEQPVVSGVDGYESWSVRPVNGSGSGEGANIR